MISDGWVWMPKKPHGELTCWVQEGWGGLEETQQSLQEAGQIMLDPNLWDFQKVALRPMDSALGLS